MAGDSKKQFDHFDLGLVEKIKDLHTAVEVSNSKLETTNSRIDSVMVRMDDFLTYSKDQDQKRDTQIQEILKVQTTQAVEIGKIQTRAEGRSAVISTIFSAMVNLFFTIFFRGTLGSK